MAASLISGVMNDLIFVCVSINKNWNYTKSWEEYEDKLHSLLEIIYHDWIFPVAIVM